MPLFLEGWVVVDAGVRAGLGANTNSWKPFPVLASKSVLKGMSVTVEESSIQ